MLQPSYELKDLTPGADFHKLNQSGLFQITYCMNFGERQCGLRKKQISTRHCQTIEFVETEKRLMVEGLMSFICNQNLQRIK